MTKEEKQEREVSLASLAIVGLRFLTPFVLSILAWNASQIVESNSNLISEMQAMQISLAEVKIQMVGKTENYDKALYDHEIRIRQLEVSIATNKGR